MFFQWCLEENYIVDNPLRKFKKRKAQERVVDIDSESLQKLIALPNLENYAGLRDYALIILTLDTGIRPGEALHLLQADFDLRRLLVTIPATVAKTRADRSLPILFADNK